MEEAKALERVKESSGGNEEDDDDLVFPGFRFHPTDQELVGFYLARKVEKKGFSIDIIKEIDIYKHDPWDLPSKLSSMFMSQCVSVLVRLLELKVEACMAISIGSELSKLTVWRYACCMHACMNMQMKLGMGCCRVHQETTKTGTSSACVGASTGTASGPTASPAPASGRPPASTSPSTAAAAAAAPESASGSRSPSSTTAAAPAGAPRRTG
jgi:hypothetical protein